MRRFICLLSLFVVTSLVAQDKKLPPITVVPYSGGVIDFDKQIQPILDNKCTTCHSGSIKKGRLDLSSHEGMVKGGKSGKVSDELIIRIAVMNLANFNPTRASRENHDWFDTTAARAAATTVMSSTAHRQGAARIFEGESHALAGRP